jgi:hypothetical protein
MRLKITRGECEQIMHIAWEMTHADEAYLFEAPRSMPFQRNKEGMLAFVRVATGNTVSRDSELMDRDTYASVEMTQETRLPPGTVTPSPNRASSALTPLLNGAHNSSKNILGLFQAVESAYKEVPAQLNKIADYMVCFMERSLRRRTDQLKALAHQMKKKEGEKERSKNKKQGEKRKRTHDLYPATVRSTKSSRFKPYYERENPRRTNPNSGKPFLSLHSQSN